MSADHTPNAFDLRTFCARNNICRSTAYKAAKAGHLRISKLYGKSLVLAEDEEAFLARLRAGALSVPRPGRRKGASRSTSGSACPAD